MLIRVADGEYIDDGLDEEIQKINIRNRHRRKMELAFIEAFRKYCIEEK